MEGKWGKGTGQEQCRELACETGMGKPEMRGKTNDDGGGKREESEEKEGALTDERGFTRARARS